jgi:hypothetical protein
MICYCRNPNLGLATKARGCKVASQVEDLGTLHMLPGVQRVWGNEPSHSQGNSHFGRWSPGGLPKLQRAIWGVKTQWLVAFFISLESS